MIESPRISRIRLVITVVLVVICLVLGWCTTRSEPTPAKPPVHDPVPVVLPVAPPPAPPVIVALPPVPIPITPPAQPEPMVEIAPPPAVPEPAALPLPVTAPVAVPPVDTQAQRRAAIRSQLEKTGYRYGGKAPGPWPQELLDQEVERRLRLERHAEPATP